MARAKKIVEDVIDLCRECFPHGWTVPEHPDLEYTTATCEHGSYVNGGTSTPADPGQAAAGEPETGQQADGGENTPADQGEAGSDPQQPAE